MSCPRCDHVHCVKNGKVEGKQRYKCKSCRFQFTHLIPRGHPPWLRALAVFLYCHGLSISQLERNKGQTFFYKHITPIERKIKPSNCKKLLNFQSINISPD